MAMVKSDGLSAIRAGTGHADRTVTTAVPVSSIPSTWVATISSDPPTVAVTVTVPSQRATKSPSSSIVPTVSSSHDQTTVPGRALLPSGSTRVAVKSRVSPSSRVTAGGETTTPGAAHMTVTSAVPVTPSAVAVMVVVPASRAMKCPSASMVPTVSSQVAQAISTSGMTLPYWSKAVAANVSSSPAFMVIAGGETAIRERTGSSQHTVMVAVAAAQSPDAVMVVVPAQRATKRPHSSTVPTAGSLLSQVSAASGTKSP